MPPSSFGHATTTNNHNRGQSMDENESISEETFAMTRDMMKGAQRLQAFIMSPVPLMRSGEVALHPDDREADGVAALLISDAGYVPLIITPESLLTVAVSLVRSMPQALQEIFAVVINDQDPSDELVTRATKELGGFADELIPKIAAREGMPLVPMFESDEGREWRLAQETQEGQVSTDE